MQMLKANPGKKRSLESEVGEEGGIQHGEGGNTQGNL